jgi:hypothetical protein
MGRRNRTFEPIDEALYRRLFEDTRRERGGLTA